MFWAGLARPRKMFQLSCFLVRIVYCTVQFAASCHSATGVCPLLVASGSAVSRGRLSTQRVLIPMERSSVTHHRCLSTFPLSRCAEVRDGSRNRDWNRSRGPPVR